MANVKKTIYVDSFPFITMLLTTYAEQQQQKIKPLKAFNSCNQERMKSSEEKPWKIEKMCKCADCVCVLCMHSLCLCMHVLHAVT